MATLNSGATKQTQAMKPTQQPTQQQPKVPVWMQGAYNDAPQTQQQVQQQQTASKNKDTLANSGPKRNDALRNNQDAGKNNDQVRLSQRPAWMDVVDAISGAAAGGTGVALGYQDAVLNAMTGAAFNNYLHSKNKDGMGPGSPMKNLNTLGRMSGRTMYGQGAPGTIDPALIAQQNGAVGGGGFGTGYGGNWRRGGGGGGGGGGWYDNQNPYSEWLKIAMGLNSWNIK